MASTIGYEKNLKVTNLHWTGKTVHKSTWCSPDQTSVDLGIVGENFFDSTYWSDRISSTKYTVTPNNCRIS